MCIRDRSRGLFDLLDRGPFQRLDDLLECRLGSFTRRLVGDLSNLVGEVALVQLVKARTLKLGQSADFSAGQNTCGN